MSLETLNRENIFDDQMKWKFLKFEIQSFLFTSQFPGLEKGEAKELF